MKQLLTIETVPISIEYKYTPIDGSKTQSARLRVSKATDSVTIKSNPISIRFDSFDTSGYRKDSSETGLTYDATARYADGGKLQLDIRLLGDPVADLDFKRVGRSIENVMGSMSLNESNSSSKTKGSLRINFDIEKLSLNAKGFENSNINFFPGDLEFEVTELPKVIIKYIGGPIYIPKSADPNYVEPEKLDVFV